MSEKSSGLDFDRQVFVQPQTPIGHPPPRIPGILLVLVVIAGVAVLGYKLLPSVMRDTASSPDPTSADIDRRLASIEERLEKLETPSKPTRFAKNEQPAEQKADSSKSDVKTVYRISPAPRQQTRPTAPATPDPATAQRLNALQQGLGTVQNNQAANQEAWQATTDKLADISGQVGSQGVEILRSQDELNQLLARTEMEAIPFELLRGSNPQPVGPVSLLLKTSNPKTRRYTVCVYVQPSCIDLRDRTLHEVVQFVVTRNTRPLEIIATNITKDEIVGYLEVPRNQSAQ
jgi:hypothetical protein